jgi:hypothetical protein
MEDLLTLDRVRLADGAYCEYQVRSSPKARSVRLRISARGGLVVTSPAGVDRPRLRALVQGKAEWIGERLSQFEAVRHLTENRSPARPEAFLLPALAESWRVEYRETRSRSVRAWTDGQGRIVVAGAVAEVQECQAALRRWLARHATQRLGPWLAGVAEQARLRYRDLVIRNQRTRWGSCSGSGRISLNCKLLFLERELVNYVMRHELCHLIEQNHSERFWNYLRVLEPTSETLHEQMRHAWMAVPGWAQRDVLLVD